MELPTVYLGVIESVERMLVALFLAAPTYGSVAPRSDPPFGTFGHMTNNKIAIASDHAGLPLKQLLAADLEAMGYEVLDLGTDGDDSVDYPDFADKLAGVLTAGEVERGVLLCGSGIGISMAANRHKGIRAAPCHDETTARLARQHNDANVLALGARLIDGAVAKACLKVFLETPFEGGRHQRRVEKMG